MNKNGIFANIDKITVLLYVLLVFIGWLNIYATRYSEDHSSIFDFSMQSGKQLMWIGTSFLVAISLLVIDPKFFSHFAYVFYGVSMVLLLIVIFIGQKTYGATSWIGVGNLGIQPSEFAKVSTALVLAKYLGETGINIQHRQTKIRVGLLIGIPIILILLQKDTGSALVFLSLILVLYREGLSGNILIVGSAAIVLFVLALLINQFILIGVIFIIFATLYYFIKKSTKNILKLAGLFAASALFVLSVDFIYKNVLEPHQKDRIDVLLGKKEDPKNIGYNINQAKIAIGSGGLLGKGFLQGTQTKFSFVPKQSTDFIFCTIGEEWGFVGCIFVIGIYIFLLIRLVMLAERQRSAFARIYGYGVVCILFTHFLINIGMVLGLLPVIGIPLPFISYGGSSLWAFTILLFIFIKQDENRLNLL